MYNILITGCNGFIGGYLAHRLSKLHKIIGITTKINTYKTFDYTIYNREFGDSIDDILEKNSIEYIIHTSYKRTMSKEYELNKEGTLRWAESGLKSNVKNQFLLNTVSSFGQKLSEYGRLKADLGKWFEENKLVNLYLGLVIGKGGFFSRISNIVQKYPLIPIVDGGNSKMYYLDIEDITAYFKYIFASNPNDMKYNSVNFFNKQTTSLLEIINEIENITGKKKKHITLSSNKLIKIFDFWEKYVKIKLPVNKNNLIGYKFHSGLNLESDFLYYGIKEKTIREILLKYF